MIYIVTVYRKGALVRTEEVIGFDNAKKIELVYADIPGYEVDINPDVFRYMRMNQDVTLS